MLRGTAGLKDALAGLGAGARLMGGGVVGAVGPVWLVPRMESVDMYVSTVVRSLTTGSAV